MINKIIDLNYHISFYGNYLLDDSPYLIGYKFYKVEEDKNYSSFATCCYLIKLDNELNIESKICLGYYLDAQVVYIDKNDNLYVKCISNEWKTFYFLSKKKNKVFTINGLNINCINDDKYLYVYDDDTNRYSVFNNSGEKVSKEGDFNKARKKYYGLNMENFYIKNIENIFKSFDYLIRTIKDINYLYLEISDEKEDDQIISVDKKNNIKLVQKIKKIEFHRAESFYVCKNKVYILYHVIYRDKKRSLYKIISYDKDSKIIEEEIIKAYSHKLTVVNNYLCLICDLPKNYTSEQKKYKNQEMMGNSTIMILEKLD